MKQLPDGTGFPAVAARRDSMDRSDICRRCATGGMRASVAGSRDTSDFMSDSSSSSWFSTWERMKTIILSSIYWFIYNCLKVVKHKYNTDNMSKTNIDNICRTSNVTFQILKFNKLINS